MSHPLYAFVPSLSTLCRFSVHLSGLLAFAVVEAGYLKIESGWMVIHHHDGLMNLFVFYSKLYCL
jgi:hypothetical protein